MKDQNQTHHQSGEQNNQKLPTKASHLLNRKTTPDFGELSLSSMINCDSGGLSRYQEISTLMSASSRKTTLRAMVM